MVTVKLHLNSVISTKGAHYCTIDLKDFYLMTPMTCTEYMRMKIKDLPEEFVTMYNLTNKASSDDFVYIKIQKGMYGLPQVGILAQELLEKRLNKHGYRQSPTTPGLWQHNYRPISFTLVWTILALSMLAANMLNTSPPFSASTTSAHTVGMGNGTSA
jgi:hypothetical protein